HPPPLVLVLLVLAVGGPSPSPAHALPDSPAHPDNPRPYAFAYAVDAPEHKNFQDREEARLGQETRGRFRVALPDNRLQTVTYRAGTNGYTASISYDQHPNFESLRQSVGPIRAGPEIGQSVLDGIRRGENWNDHKGVKEDDRPQLSSSLSSHGSTSNLVNPTPTRTRLTPTRTNPTPSRTRTRVTPTRTRVTPTRTQTTAVHSTRGSTSRRRQRPRVRRPSTVQPTPRVTAASSPPAVTGARRTSPRPSARPSARPSSRPSPSPSPTPTEEPESSEVNSEDSVILNRLINVIQEKLAADKGEEDTSGPPHAKKYAIKDRESVRKRLEAIVHKY
ncbi:chromatin-remodeling ATPase INO80-like, partial [Portunus trituberculatus]|uniref:chromatin-remodeling ATPase INO80-like n=1 Tax=Portunus trituberculatus TaxID=210409 RepID=UPI001E1D01FD